METGEAAAMVVVSLGSDNQVNNWGKDAAKR